MFQCVEHRLNASDINRFLTKIEPSTPDDCWVWNGGHFQQTHYAMFSVRRDDGKWVPTTAHRIAWTLFNEEAPVTGMHIDHLCRNRWCVNPWHLEQVTPQTNTLRGEGPSAKCAQQTHCVHGHEFTDENTYRRPNGRRECRECMRGRDRQRDRTGYTPPCRR